MACAQSARYNTDYGWIADGASPGITPPVTTVMIDGVLSERGYRSALVTSNPFIGTPGGTARSFDTVIDLSAANAAAVNAEALPTLEAFAEGDQPWYFHVHYLDPHTPYNPPEAYLDGLQSEDIPFNLASESGYNDLRDQFAGLDADDQALVLTHLHTRYSGEMAYVDDKIGELLSHAESLGLLEDTLIVFFTDHGEQLLEHNIIGHDDDIYDTEVRAVASFTAPGLSPSRWAGPTVHQDIWPTALSLMGQDPVEPFDGVIAGDAPADSPSFAERYTQNTDSRSYSRQTVKQGEWKLIYGWLGSKELYNLDDAPGEQTNLYDSTDPNVTTLWELLMPKVETLDALVTDTPVDPGP